MHVVDVYHDIRSIDERVWLLAGSCDIGIVVFYLGSWFVTVLDLVFGVPIDIDIGIGPLFLSPLSEV